MTGPSPIRLMISRGPKQRGQTREGTYSDQGCVPHALARADNPDPGIPADEQNNSDFSREARSTWIRLMLIALLRAFIRTRAVLAPQGFG